MSLLNKSVDTDVPKNNRMYGTDTNGNVIPIQTDLSGQIAVDVDVGDVIAIVSGPVTLTSGIVWIGTSGSTSIASIGALNADGYAVGTQVLYNGSYLIGYDKDADKWNRLRVNKSGQGALVVATSGSDYIISKISGDTIVVASGEALIIEGTDGTKAGVRSISDGAGTINGLQVNSFPMVWNDGASRWSRIRENISGQGGIVVASSGQTYVLAKISGEVLKQQAPSAVLAGYTQVSSVSGGVQVASGSVVSLRIRSVTKSGILWIGSPGINSGTGYYLAKDEATDTLTIDNLNKVYAVAEMSGDYLSWISEVE